MDIRTLASALVDGLYSMFRPLMEQQIIQRLQAKGYPLRPKSPFGTYQWRIWEDANMIGIESTIPIPLVSLTSLPGLTANTGSMGIKYIEVPFHVSATLVFYELHDEVIWRAEITDVSRVDDP